MSLLNGIKRHFIMIFGYGAQIEPIVIEFLPSVKTVTSQAEFPSLNIP